MSSRSAPFRRRLERLRRPGRLWRSVRLSFAYDPLRWWKMPIIAARTARIERERGTVLRLGQRLVLGYDAYPPRPGIAERGTSGALIWLIQQGSTFETEGVVAIAQGVQISIGGGGHVRIQDGTSINANTRILCTDSIEIGRRCAISWSVHIIDFDGHQIGDPPQPSTAPIRIGSDVWIGARATLLKGVEIGDGAIVAAQAVVTHSVPPRSLVAGNPARVVREDVLWHLFRSRSAATSPASLGPSDSIAIVDGFVEVS
jgi:acetyltransferase-like isoleucine patch superfamily enzyme